MKQINKTTAEFLINVVMVLSFTGVAVNGMWWASLPAILICCIRVYNNIKQMIKSKKGITKAKVVKVLNKAGYLVQVIEDGALEFESNGHIYSIMCHENGNIQFARRYMVPAEQIQTLRKAAEKTMSEVYMAKVIVDNCDDPGKGFMVFSVETVCSSEKELKATIRQHMRAIDQAEESQRQHAEQLQSSQPQTVERKRIGFV